MGIVLKYKAKEIAFWLARSNSVIHITPKIVKNVKLSKNIKIQNVANIKNIQNEYHYYSSKKIMTANN